MDRINGADHIDIGGGRRGFRDENPGGGVWGTEVAAAWLNGVQEEIAGVIEGEGIELSDADWTQLAKALRRFVGRGLYVADTGAADALVVAPGREAPEGSAMIVKVAATNTGATSIAVDGADPVPLTFVGGLDLTAGTLVAGDYVLLVAGAASWVLQTRLATTANPGLVALATEDEVRGATGAGVVRAEHLGHYTRTLTAPLTLYVRSDGDDANDGLSNTAGGALATIQAAVDLAFLHGPGPYAVTIYVGAGTYGPVATPARPGPALIIIGNVVTPSSVTIANAAGHAFGIYGPNTATVSGIKATTTVSSDRGGFISYAPSTLTLDQCETGPCTGGAIHALGGQVSVSSHKYSGGAQVLLLANVGGTIFPSGVHAITAAITISGAVANASGGGNIRVSASSPLSFTGGASVTGKRYSAVLNGIIDTLGGGPNFFPGTVAGTSSSGGQYA